MLRRGCTVVALVVAAWALEAQAAVPHLCWEDAAGLAAPARAGLARELQTLLPGVVIERASGERVCGEADAIRLTVKYDRSGIPTDALGLAHARDGRIEPRLEVFVAPIVRLTGASDWEVVGRALARVAAHEALHYLLQRADHDTEGLFSDALTAAELTRRDRPIFRLALARPR